MAQCENTCDSAAKTVESTRQKVDDIIRQNIEINEKLFSKIEHQKYELKMKSVVLEVED